MTHLKLILSQKGYNATKYTPFYLSALNKLFDTLKYYTKENYRINNDTIDRISFEMISGINTFAERVKIKNNFIIIIGKNLDVLLELYNQKQLFTDKHFTLVKYIIFSKLIIQKFLIKSKIKEASWMYNFCLDIYDEYTKFNRTITPKAIENKQIHLTKIKSYLFIMSHEFGHILYRMGKLEEEKKVLLKYINNIYLDNGEELLKHLFLWDSYFDTFSEISNGNPTLKNYKSKIDVNDYKYSSKKGIEKLIQFSKMIGDDTSMQEEIVCDIFAIRFFIITFGINDGFVFLKSLNRVQSALTLSYHLFESDKTLTSNIFYKSFARYIINPELLSTLFKIDTNNYIDDAHDTFIQTLLSIYSYLNNSINDFEINNIPDFFENPIDYQNFINELYEFSKITE